MRDGLKVSFARFFNEICSGDIVRLRFREPLFLIRWNDSKDDCYRLLHKGCDLRNSFRDVREVAGYVVSYSFTHPTGLDEDDLIINPFGFTDDPDKNRQGSIVIPMLALHRLESYQIVERGLEHHVRERQGRLF